jgi:N-acetyl sugar amidotransferase
MQIIKRCKVCLMADTKPGLVLDKDGVCQACRNHKRRRRVNWSDRAAEFKDLCVEHINCGAKWDCVIPASGGKDSWYQVKTAIDHGLKPVIFRVTDPYTHPLIGQENWRNMLECFQVDGFTFELSPQTVRDLTIRSFVDFGSPTWPIDRAIYVLPLKFAKQMDIPLVIYGENVSYEYGGVQAPETASAKDQISNDVAKSIDLRNMQSETVILEDMYSLKGLNTGDLAMIEPVYLSYYFPWSGFKNYCDMSKYGFQSSSDICFSRRNGYIEDYDQIDSVGYLINVWMKWVKFGFNRATDVVGYWIRDGLITRHVGRALIMEHDSKLDRRVLNDFLRFTQLSKEEFLDIANLHYVAYSDELKDMDLSWDNYYETMFDHEAKKFSADDMCIFDNILMDLNL